MNIITFKHSGHAGDIIYSLASIAHICKKKEAKAILYIACNVKTDLKNHPSGSVMIPDKMYEFLRPLIVIQKYIAGVEKYDGREVDYDLDLFRTQFPNINLSATAITHWYGMVYPELFPDLSYPWIRVSPILHNEVILARTERYLNALTNPQGNIDKGIFMGTKREWDIVNQLPNNLQYKQVESALEMARMISGAKYVISNQTLFFAIAEAMKVPRVLEQYWYAPNVIPTGGQYYIYNTNEQLKKILLTLQSYGGNK